MLIIVNIGQVVVVIAHHLVAAAVNQVMVAHEQEVAIAVVGVKVDVADILDKCRQSPSDMWT